MLWQRCWITILFNYVLHYFEIMLNQASLFSWFSKHTHSLIDCFSLLESIRLTKLESRARFTFLCLNAFVLISCFKPLLNGGSPFISIRIARKCLIIVFTLLDGTRHINNFLTEWRFDNSCSFALISLDKLNLLQFLSLRILVGISSLAMVEVFSWWLVDVLRQCGILIVVLLGLGDCALAFTLHWVIFVVGGGTMGHENLDVVWGRLLLWWLLRITVLGHITKFVGRFNFYGVGLMFIHDNATLTIDMVRQARGMWSLLWIVVLRLIWSSTIDLSPA